MLYIYLAIFAVFIYSLYAQVKVSTTFSKYSKTAVRSGLSAAQLATRILHDHGVFDVGIERVHGNLTDHYDPRANVLRLSDSVYDSSSAAAIGVAAHEAGHAIQYAKGYLPVRLRMLILPAVRFGSYGVYLFLLLGILFSAPTLITVGIFCFSLMTFFQFVTLPVEFNASRRALRALSEGYLHEEELSAAKAVLSAAAMTYVAAFAMSLLQLLRLVMMFRRRD